MGSVLLIVLAFYFGLYFVCIRPVFCVSNVASVSGLSIHYCPSIFSNVYYLSADYCELAL